jgi:hypothetical protein
MALLTCREDKGSTALSEAPGEPQESECPGSIDHSDKFLQNSPKG